MSLGFWFWYNVALWYCFSIFLLVDVNHFNAKFDAQAFVRVASTDTRLSLYKLYENSKSMVEKADISTKIEIERNAYSMYMQKLWS